MTINIYYDKSKELDPIDIKRIVNCINEASCPNEALRGASKRFKALYQHDNLYEVMLDFKNKDEIKNIGKITI